MTSIRKLKMVVGAGEPDAVPSRRIDVVAAAEALYDAMNEDDDYRIVMAQGTLCRSVERYRRAVKARASA